MLSRVTNEALCPYFSKKQNEFAPRGLEPGSLDFFGLVLYKLGYK